MRVLVFAAVLLFTSSAYSFSYATGGCINACAEGEDFLHTNANEIDTALDSAESAITTLQARDTIAEHESVDTVNVILGTEIDTAAELNTLTTDTDMVLDTDIGTTVQAYDADLADLADGSLSGSKIGTGVDASTLTTGTIGSTAQLPSAVIETTEIDTTSELNAILVDDDLITSEFTGDLVITGTGIFSGTLNGGVRTTDTATTTYSPIGTFLLGDFHRFTSATGVDVTLPAAADGLNACFYDGNGGGVVILDAAAGDEILLDGVGVGVADAIDSAGALGDFICLLAVDSTYWITLGRSGTWVDGGAD